MTKLKAIMDSIPKTQGAIASEVGLIKATYVKQIGNSDNKPSTLKKYAEYLDKIGVRKRDEFKWEWWELEGDVYLSFPYQIITFDSVEIYNNKESE